MGPDELKPSSGLTESAPAVGEERTVREVSRHFCRPARSTAQTVKGMGPPAIVGVPVRSPFKFRSIPKGGKPPKVSRVK